MGAGKFAPAGMSFFKFASQQLFNVNQRPFTLGALITFALLGSLSLNGDKEARKASGYLNPKHH